MVQATNSEWYMAAAFEGRLIVTQGMARCDIDGEQLRAVCRFSEGSGEYTTLVGKVEGDDSVSAIAKSADPAVPDVNLDGKVFREGLAISVVLTDGWTTMGISMARA